MICSFVGRGVGLVSFMAGISHRQTPNSSPVTRTTERRIRGQDLKNRCLEIYDALVECSAFVNYRRRGSRIVIPRMTPDLVA